VKLGRGQALALCSFVRDEKTVVEDNGIGVDRHGGRIWVDLLEGGGTSFRFWLPRE
jgi:hypothetical protein